MSAYLNVNAIFCEEAKSSDDGFDIINMFNVIEDVNEEDMSKGFCVVSLIAAKGSLDCTLYFMLETVINENDVVAKKLIDLPIQLEEDLAVNRTNVIRFKTKNLISKPGKYVLAVFCVENQIHDPNLSLKEILKSGERISTTQLEVK